MHLLEWLIILLVYIAAYGLWSGLEARRERAPYRPQKGRVRRRVIRFGVLALCLLGLGLAYNSPAVQEIFSDSPQTSYAQPEAERVLSSQSESSQDDARLVVAPPPLLGVAQNAPERTPGTIQEVSVAALPKTSTSVSASTPRATPPATAPSEVTPPQKTSAERASTRPAQPSQRVERPIPNPTPNPVPSPRPTVISPQPLAPQVRVSFQSDPAGATLYVEGERVGVTPTSISVEAGKRLHYTLRAEDDLPNHRLYYPHLDVLEAEQDINLNVWLERLNSEEVAALQARGGARSLPDFDSFD